MMNTKSGRKEKVYRMAQLNGLIHIYQEKYTMNRLTDKLMEKIGPFAEMVSTNKYLCSLRDGFMVAFPATMFASIAIIIQYLPATFGLEGVTPSKKSSLRVRSF